MVSTSSHVLTALRRSLAAELMRPAAAPEDRVSLGASMLDEPLGGGLTRAALHEVHAPGTADLAAATGFAMALAVRAAGERPILWVRQDFLDGEAGWLYPPGLAEFGLDPARVLLVRARDAEAVLRVAVEAARCASLGAALIMPWGAPPILDLTASRRLALAAEASGTLTLMLRVPASAAPSAARTRWRVGALPSRALAANAPGNPSFAVTLLRHRGGVAEREWRVEWNRDRKCFQDRIRPDAAPVSRPVVPLSVDRPAAAAADAFGFRKAG
jgi:protein ImuA